MRRDSCKIIQSITVYIKFLILKVVISMVLVNFFLPKITHSTLPEMTKLRQSHDHISVSVKAVAIRRFY